MTNNDRMLLLRQAVADLGSQAKVGKALGYSSATVSQVLSESYGGQLDQVLTRVEEVFGTAEMDCPILGIIAMPICVAERRKPFTTANPHRVRMYQTCRKCKHNTDEQTEE